MQSSSWFWHLLSKRQNHEEDFKRLCIFLWTSQESWTLNTLCYIYSVNSSSFNGILTIFFREIKCIFCDMFAPKSHYFVQVIKVHINFFILLPKHCNGLKCSNFWRLWWIFGAHELQKRIISENISSLVGNM